MSNYARNEVEEMIQDLAEKLAAERARADQTEVALADLLASAGKKASELRERAEASERHAADMAAAYEVQALAVTSLQADRDRLRASAILAFDAFDALIAGRLMSEQTGRAMNALRAALEAK